LHALRTRPCSQRPLPPQCLQRSRRRPCCSQRPLLPQSLQNLRSRPCSHLPSFAVFFAGAALFFALSSAAAAFAAAFAAPVAPKRVTVL
jgi:hypothetical protein